MGRTVFLYRSASGKPIIEKAIDKLNPLTQARIRNLIRLLKEYGLDTTAGHSIKKLSTEPPVFEARILGKKQIRLLFSSPEKNTIFIVHLFVKKTQKTPLKELHLAKKRALEIDQL